MPCLASQTSKKILPSQRQLLQRTYFLKPWGECMRKSKFPPRDLRLRLLLGLTGALLMVAASVPTAKADLIVYFNFEDSRDEGPPDFTSDIVPENPGGGVLLTTITTDYNS